MESSNGVSIIGILIGLFALGVALALFIFWLWMLIHALSNKGIGGSEKVAWVLVVLFGSLIGAAVYFFVGKPKGG